MQKQTKNQGFTAIEAIIIILVLSLVGLAIWYVMNAKKESTDGIDAAKNVSNIAAVQKDRAQLTQYKNDEYGFTFDYPKDWEVTTDLKDIGRGHAEGEVVAVSPNDTKVTFRPNLGGKGGDCWDEAANARTKNTCQTLVRFSVEQLTLGTSNQPVYFVTGSLTDPLRDGGKTKLFIGLESGSDTPQTGETLTDAYPGTLKTPKLGYVDVAVSGPEDYKNDTEAFFETTQVKEATLVLKSFRFNK